MNLHTPYGNAYCTWMPTGIWLAGLFPILGIQHVFMSFCSPSVRQISKPVLRTVPFPGEAQAIRKFFLKRVKLLDWVLMSQMYVLAFFFPLANSMRDRKKVIPLH